MESFYQLVKQRHSTRKYLPLFIEKEKINKIMQAALMAPSSRHANSWEFIVVDDMELLAKLSKCRASGSTFVGQALTAIVVLGNPEKSDLWEVDASIASTYIQLAVADLGMGSCWAHVAGKQYNDTTSSEDYVKKLLGIPKQMRVLNVIAIGYKGERHQPFDEERLEYEKIHYNRY